MDLKTVTVNGIEMKVYSLNTVVVGSGAAGFNAADTLFSFGQKDIAIVTEGINKGTSRNTGSDKQTYYKLTLEGDSPDSIKSMAKTLFNGGAMHGDIALVESALSAKCFYKLTDIGVSFPHNKYGEYIGYKTDHDPRKRATSAGPLTSRIMTEKLESHVKSKGIKIFDRFFVIGILTDKKRSKNEKVSSIGVIALNLNEIESPNMGFTVFNCTNIVYATGGPARMYLSSVYPGSQTGCSGVAFEAGIKGINLTESQFGIASIKFRWNLSGTYQQVIPRYISMNQDGTDEKEFLESYFETPSEMLNAIFLKGYHWPFDPRKIENAGSSLIDILVYNEIHHKGRRVYIDFMDNPTYGSKDGKIDFSLLSDEAFVYLKNSNALFGKPIDRLCKMNQPAFDIYMENGIDLSKEYLEVAVCAQHNNGGLVGNIWWESNIKHFFPVGEVCGTFGVYRPGGSALNSTQVGSFRAAQYISENYTQKPRDIKDFLESSESKISQMLDIAKNSICKNNQKPGVFELRKKMQSRMSEAGSHIRSLEVVNRAIQECLKDFSNFDENSKIESVLQIPEVFKNRDILITQFVYLNAIKGYILEKGKSRGSYLVYDRNGVLPNKKLNEKYRYSLDDGQLMKKVCETGLVFEGETLKCHSCWNKVRPIPNEDNWFETVWDKYRKNEIIK